MAFPWRFRGVSCAAHRVARTRSRASRFSGNLRARTSPHRRSDVRNRVRCFAIEPNQRASRNVNSSSIAPSRFVAWETSLRISSSRSVRLSYSASCVLVSFDHLIVFRPYPAAINVATVCTVCTVCALSPKRLSSRYEFHSRKESRKEERKRRARARDESR